MQRAPTVAFAPAVSAAFLALAACSGDIGAGGGPDLSTPPGAAGSTTKPGPGPGPNGQAGNAGAAGQQGAGGAAGATPPSAPLPTPPVCTAPKTGPAPMRRLTHREYDNTVNELIGDTKRLGNDFPEESLVFGFENNAAVQEITESHAQRYLSAADQLASDAVGARLATILPKTCAARDDACAGQFVEAFLKRAFRRPLERAEIDRYVDVYRKGKAPSAGGTFESGIRLVIQAALISPSFLFRVEAGLADGAADGTVKLSPFEVASRLSFLIWGRMPDPELFAAAEGGRLQTTAEVGEHAARLLKHEHARGMATDFHSLWLRTYEVEAVEKDTDVVYKGFPVRALGFMRKETDAFVRAVLFDGDAKLKTLLTAPFTFANRTLAQVYGLDQMPANDATFARVETDPNRRFGLLTQGSFLASQSQPDLTDPVLRGKLIREQLFCGPDNLQVPDPDTVPDNIKMGLSFMPPQPTAGKTARELHTPKLGNSYCAACHRPMDLIGFGFENYDAVGRWRTAEGLAPTMPRRYSPNEGKPIDASGEIIEADDVKGPFNGARELMDRLAVSQTVRDCVVDKWFAYAYGRVKTEADACAVEALKQRFKSSDHDVRQIIVGLTQTHDFLRRPAVATP